jgi:hypothetical protein
MDESDVQCSTVLAGEPNVQTGTLGSSTLVLTATCRGCNAQRIGYLSSGDMTTMG